jgi:hypothetical protein
VNFGISELALNKAYHVESELASSEIEICEREGHRK